MSNSESSPSSTENDAIRFKIDDLRERIFSLKTADKRSYINFYCDQLQSDVMIAIDSGIAHLKEIEILLLDQIGAYRDDLLLNLRAEEMNKASPTSDFAVELEDINQRIEETSKMVNELSERCTSWQEENLDQLIQSHIQECQKRLDVLEKNIKELTFSGKFMKFSRNNMFFFDTNNIGKLEIFKETNEFKTIRLSEHKSNSWDFGSFITSVLFLSNGNLVVSTQDSPMKIVDVATMSIIHEFSHSPDCEIWALAEMPDGTVVSGSQRGTMYLWDLRTKKKKAEFGDYGCVVDLKVLPNSNVAALTEQGIVKIFNPYMRGPSRLLRKFGVNVYSVFDLGVLSNGFVVTCTSYNDPIVRIWDPNNGTLFRQIDAACFHATQMNILPNDDIVLYSHHRGIVKVMNISDDSLSRHFFLFTKTLMAFAQPANEGLLVAHLCEDPLKPITRTVSKNIKKNEDFDVQHHHAFNLSGNKRLLAGQSPKGILNIWNLDELSCN